MRASGILMHISSLPSPYGIGTFGEAARRFVDFLSDAGQRYWQILPVGPTSFGDSPYQAFSTFAGNPYFIDLDILCQQGLLQKGEFEGLDWGNDLSCVDFEKIYERRFPVLRRAFQRFQEKDALDAFCREQAPWLEDYALFMALKQQFEGKAWLDWEEGARLRRPEALSKYREQLSDEIRFWSFLQYQFYQQWNELKAYARQKGVGFIGDLPIYVAMDSSDVWSNPELFCLDKGLHPELVAGVPPDYFSPDGQLWGNPLYRWEVHKNTGYSWWIERIRAAAAMFDIVRIDHFRGFASFCAIPYGDKNARRGEWHEGPRMDFFKALEKALGRQDIIAEDLGEMTPDVGELLEASGYPGMKVLQFAFDNNWNNVYLPHNHMKNCVVYTGTHDNDTTVGWWETALSKEDRRHAGEYLGLNFHEGIAWGLIRAAWSSVADLAVAPVQDLLGLGGEARMNTPSTLGSNWSFRLREGMLTAALAERLEHLSGLYQRSTH